MYAFLLNNDKFCIALTLFSLVGMALPKAAGCMIVLLALFYCLENVGYSQSLSAVFKVRFKMINY